MSLGYGGWCLISSQDKEKVIYKYGSYNLNYDANKNDNRISDGAIIIDKSSFVEPDIHKKIKRLPNGKKKVIVKRIGVDVPFESLIQDNKIIIQNTNNTWKVDESGNDFIARQLIHKIFSTYQQNGELSEMISFNV